MLSFGLVWLTMSELARLHRLGALVMDVMARVLEVEYGPQSPMFEPIEIPCTTFGTGSINSLFGFVAT